MWILFIIWILEDRCQSPESHRKPKWTVFKKIISCIHGEFLVCTQAKYLWVLVRRSPGALPAEIQQRMSPASHTRVQGTKSCSSHETAVWPRSNRRHLCRPRLPTKSVNISWPLASSLTRVFLCMSPNSSLWDVSSSPQFSPRDDDMSCKSS